MSSRTPGYYRLAPIGTLDPSLWVQVGPAVKWFDWLVAEFRFIGSGNPFSPPDAK